MADVGTILVTGGTGTTGRRLTWLLRRRGAPVRVASRHPDPADENAVRFDWNDPATHQAVVNGVERLYLLRPTGVGTDPQALVERFLATARAAGVRRVVLLHSTVTGPAGLPEIARAVERTTPEWAVLHPSWFMQNFVGDHPMARAVRERGEIATATGRGRVGFIDADDIAASAAELLLAAKASNSHYVLTGPETLGYTEVAEIIGEVTGHQIRHVDLTSEQLAARWAAAGLPDDLARVGAELDEAIARGEQDFTSTAVEEITGRPPRSLRDFVRAHRDAWRNGAPDQA